MASLARIKLVFSICALISIKGELCAQFLGGNGSGYSRIGVTNSVCSVTTINAFGGGSADGFSNIGITNMVCSVTTPNAFGGGNSDGYSNIGITNSVCTVITINAFGGGSSDGHSSIGVTNSVCTVTTINPFGGGSSDGYSRVGITNGVCTVTTINAFSGGASSGYSSVAEIVLDHTSCITLPVELVFFDAILDGNQVLLNWQTSTETNNDYFTIEKSTNGIDFVDFTSVKGAGYSNQLLDYSMVDYTPYFGKSYYRLKQTDYDGQFTYSSVKAINYEIDFEAQVDMYPNPVPNEEFYIELSHPVCHQLTMQLKDLSGKLVASSSATVSGSRLLHIDLLEKPVSGIYFVTISCEQFLVTKKLVFE